MIGPVRGSACIFPVAGAASKAGQRREQFASVFSPFRGKGVAIGGFEWCLLNPACVSIAMSAIVFGLSVARQVQTLHIWAGRRERCRRIALRIWASAAINAAVGGAICLIQISHFKVEIMTASPVTVVVMACYDFSSDGGRRLLKMMVATWLRSVLHPDELPAALKRGGSGSRSSRFSRSPTSPSEDRSSESSAESNPPNET